ncbi:gastrula zinc finger protein XlCGF9.1 [Austrofundulus limnaeus]|uniref:Gastrula zinc finger protein XlCGF9.1 n=1 Tax=Austrofundulus limnaeus TaxID=52670 RepID=A0A2I4DB94_AUSLI|nr:PREDICTED: gastrula zinc finger protein XlCGF9.1-like [Austrofundulus limnaeus]
MEEFRVNDQSDTSSPMPGLAENQNCKSPDGSEDKGGGGFDEDQLIRSVEAPEGPHCSDQSEESSTLEISNQQQLNNSEERPFTSDQCGNGFKRMAFLLDHVNFPTGHRPYACDQCVKAFKQKAHLLGHLRTHTGEKPYTCDQCGKRFARKNNLKAHQRIHSREKP